MCISSLCLTMLIEYFVFTKSCKLFSIYLFHYVLHVLVYDCDTNNSDTTNANKGPPLSLEIPRDGKFGRQVTSSLQPEMMTKLAPTLKASAQLRVETKSFL